MFVNHSSEMLIDKLCKCTKREVSASQRCKGLKHFIVALTIGAVTVVHAQNTNSGNQNAAVQKFKSTSGEYQKRELLATLIQKDAAKSQTNQVLEESTIPDILNAALEDESPVVVEQAIRVIKDNKRRSFTKQVIKSYTDAELRFGGYSERVKLSALSALGEISDSESSKLFSEILSKENASAIAEHTLLAIQTSGDKSLAEDVKTFATRMDMIVEQARRRGNDPLLYSQSARLSQLANTIYATLSK